MGSVRLIIAVLRVFVSAVALWLTSGWFLSPALAEDANYTGPLFDTHLHYSRPAWSQYSPDDVLEKLDKANVTKALVSSTPDEGSVKLLQVQRQLFIAGLRPYRTAAEKVGWYKKPELMAYAKSRLATNHLIAFGEVILNYAEDLETPQMREYLDIAAAQKLILHLHTGADVVEALFKLRPGLKILWAHAGFSEPPEVITRQLEQNPNLWAELSYRAADIMGGTDIEPEWKELLLRYPERFTIGSDTWENSRWRFYQSLINEHREWLGKLPKNVAEKIAYTNAETLLE